MLNMTTEIFFSSLLKKIINFIKFWLTSIAGTDKLQTMVEEKGSLL